MQKKVLIISASPRKNGNSDRLCEEFKRGAMEGGNETEKIFLGDHKIGFCQGCGFCAKSGVCVQKDDMKTLLEKMVHSDVIVLATPTYFYTMDGQMKTFLDRTVPSYQEISGKEFYFIITAWDPDPTHLKRVVEEFRGYTDCLNNPIEKGILLANGVTDKTDVLKTDYMAIAYQFGKEA